MMKAKFIGKFKDLKPLGFTFHKLFAREYKVYEKNGIWIWVAGRNIEIEDYYEKSPYIIDFIIKKKYPIAEEDIKCGPLTLIKKGEADFSSMNLKTFEIKRSKDIPFEERYNPEIYRNCTMEKKWIKTINEIKHLIQIGD